MPSKDQMNEKAWAWLSDRAKQRVKKPVDRVARSAAHVLDLALRAGLDAEELASRIPADTLRRLKFPMLVQVQKDGTRKFEHDLGIVRDARRGLLATDRGTDGVLDAPKPRDESGRFVKN